MDKNHEIQSRAESGHEKRMALRIHFPILPLSVSSSSSSFCNSNSVRFPGSRLPTKVGALRSRSLPMISAALPPLDLTEDNIRRVLADSRTEFPQIFDTSVGMTGQVDLAELDGPFVKISLKGRFWHKRETVLARISNYLKNRIPEILEVDIEDEKQLDDSPANF